MTTNSPNPTFWGSVGQKGAGPGYPLRAPTRRYSPALTAITLSAVWWLQAPVPAHAQQPEPGTIRNFSAAPEYYPPPNQAQMKSLLQGTEARILPDGRIGVTQLKIRTFNNEGQPELQVEAPECTYDPRERAAYSPGKLRVQSGDNKFSLEGQGFLWQQTNSSLNISSQVHTVVQPNALDKVPGQTRTNVPARELTGLDVLADQFSYSATTGLGIYRGNVQVTGTNLSLTSGLLTLAVPMAERLLQSLTAEENVVFNYQEVRATGERMHYDALADIVRVTGQPTWSAAQREGRGDELFIDRTNSTFRATGHAWLKMPAHNAGRAGFLPAPATAAESSSTNQTLEIACDRYEIRTNLAVFRDTVVVTQFAEKQPQGTMTCALLTVELSGTNQLQKLVAENHVIIQQQDNQLSAGRAVYNGTNGWLELTENPSWRAALRQGKGRTIKVDTTRNEMLVVDDALMRLPADQFGGAAALLTATNTGIASNSFAEIFSEHYSVNPQEALFEGDVLIKHPQMTWRCATLSAQFPSNHIEGARMVAERGVVFDLANPEGATVHGKSEKAVYFTETSAGRTNSFVELTGNPVLETTNGILQNKIIILDIGNQRLVAPGKFKMKGTLAAANTNAFQLPKTFK
jgi:lipopolysaccharide export system protein LptA